MAGGRQRGDADDLGRTEGGLERAASHDARPGVGVHGLGPAPCAQVSSGRRNGLRLDRVGGGVAVRRTGGAGRRAREAETDARHREADRTVVGKRRRVRVEQPETRRGQRGGVGQRARVEHHQRCQGHRHEPLHEWQQGGSGVDNPFDRLRHTELPLPHKHRLDVGRSELHHTQPRPGIEPPAEAVADEQMKWPDGLDPDSFDPRERVVAALDPSEQRCDSRVRRGEIIHRSIVNAH